MFPVIGSGMYSENLNSKHLNNKLLLVLFSNGLLFRCLYHSTGHLNCGPVFKW